LTICARTETSSAETGSSHTTSLGERASARDGDALALAAGELVREALGVRCGKADAIEQATDAAGLLVAWQARDRHRLAQDRFDAHARIERAIGTLRDELDLRPQRPQRALGEGGEIGAVEQDAPGGRVYQPQQQLAGGGLAAATLADQAEGLAGGDGEADTIHRAHGAARPPAQEPAAQGEMLLQVLDTGQRGGGGHAAASAGTA
jgi:hypothetical protein